MVYFQQHMEGSVGNQTGKSQSIIGRAKPIDYRLYNRIFVSYVKQHTTGPLKTTKKAEHVSSWLKTDCQTCKVIISCQRCKVIHFTVENHQ